MHGFLLVWKPLARGYESFPLLSLQYCDIYIPKASTLTIKDKKLSSRLINCGCTFRIKDVPPSGHQCGPAVLIVHTDVTTADTGPPTDQSDCCICYNYILIALVVYGTFVQRQNKYVINNRNRVFTAGPRLQSTTSCFSTVDHAVLSFNLIHKVTCRRSGTCKCLSHFTLVPSNVIMLYQKSTLYLRYIRMLLLHNTVCTINVLYYPLSYRHTAEGCFSIACTNCLRIVSFL